MSLAVDINNVSCSMDGRWILRNINWKIEKGEQWIVFGLNGCGKTTLLSTLSGYYKPDVGTLKILGEEYRKDNIFELRQRVGFVSLSFFSKYLYNEKALDIVLSGLTGTLAPRGYMDNHSMILAKKLLSNFFLKDKEDFLFRNMSKGEQQSVLLARAFISDPDILVLDEPGTGLDVIARENILQLTNYCASALDKTVIYVTHYIEEILPAFKKCMLMRNGRVYKKADTEDILKDDVLSKFLHHQATIHRIHENDISRFYLEINDMVEQKV